MLLSGLSIRPFQAKDQEAARQVILDGLGGHFGYIDESLNPVVDDIMASYIVPGHVFVVAEVRGNLVGTGALVIEREDVGRIRRVSVQRGCRRKGIGSALVKHLVGIARHRGLKRLLVETNNDWHDAIRLYKHCGFMEYERDDVSVYMVLVL
jgi:GNAT superfamily N-acetyltransferase